MSQTNYDNTFNPSIAGMKVSLINDEVISRKADGIIGFGLGVGAVAGEVDSVKIPTATSDIFRGISLQIHKEQDLDGIVQYEDKEMVSVLKKGDAWVLAAKAVTADDDAYIDIAGTANGKFTDVSTGNLATGGKFLTSTSGAGLVKISINLP